MNSMIRSLMIALFACVVVSAQSSSRSVGFSIFDKNGQHVTGVKAGDIKLRIGKTEMSVESLDEISDQRLDLMILIDRSVSQEASFEKQKAAIANLIQEGLKPQQDRVAIASFANKVTLHADLSADLGSALKGIPSIAIEYPPGYVASAQGSMVALPPGRDPLASGGTAIWDSIFETSVALGRVDSESRRKVLLIFTDGYNTVGKRKKIEAAVEAGKHGVSVFFVGVGDPKFSGTNENGLRRFAEEAAGTALFPNGRMSDLNDTALRIVGVMRNSYMVTYRSTAGSGEIEIEVSTRKDVRVSSHTARLK